MVDTVTEASVWSRNAQGHAIVKLVDSTSDAVGTLGADSIPLDSEGAMIMAVAGGLNTNLSTTLAGENIEKGWFQMEAGATQNKTVLSGKTDFLLGSIGGVTDYLKRVNVSVSASETSRVVLKEGNPIPKKQINTSGSTASTTTTLNTTINPDAVVADQYKDHLVRVGTSAYRKILSHPSYAAGVVNSYTLDAALPTAPATNVAIYIENPDLVIEILPNGVTVGTHTILIERYCSGPGWRLSTETACTAFCSGDFDNV